MSADTTPRNGRVNSEQFTTHPDLLPPKRPAIKIEKAEVGPTVTDDAVDSEQFTLTARDRIQGWVTALQGWLLGFFIPPQSLMEAPPGWSELTAYAYRGSWTKSGRSFLRGLGTLWLCLVALPTVARIRLKEWIISRPSRGFFFILIAELVLRGMPVGHWISDNVIRAWFHGLAWIFLP